MNAPLVLAEFVVIGLLSLVVGILFVAGAGDLELGQVVVAADRNIGLLAITIIPLSYLLGAISHRIVTAIVAPLRHLITKSTRLSSALNLQSATLDDDWYQVRIAAIYQHASVSLLKELEYIRSVHRLLITTTVQWPALALGVWWVDRSNSLQYSTEVLGLIAVAFLGSVVALHRQRVILRGFTRACLVAVWAQIPIEVKSQIDDDLS
jgi:hypothetical protein